MRLTDSRYSFNRVGGSWIRRDSQELDSRVFVLSPSDLSREVVGIHGNYPGSEYDARCPTCYLGFAHSLDYHRRNIGEESPCLI
jgi:hypothetical protein